MIYNALTDTVRNLLTSNARQGCKITFSGTDVSYSGIITENDIGLNGLTVDRMCVSGSAIEIGSAIASELLLTLKNTDGTFNNVRFEGSELYVKITVKDGENTLEIPLGYFTVDKPTRPLSSINISALDRMVLFDKPVNWSNLSFPITVDRLLDRICYLCNVPYNADDIAGRPNSDYSIPKAPEDQITYRQILQWIAEITATCAFIDWEGKLRLTWYDYGDDNSNIAETFTTSNRYSSDLYENDITITGVKVVEDEEHSYLIGNDRYAINIEGNGLIQSKCSEIAANIADKVVGFSYRPYEAVTQPMPFLYPLDTVNFIDRNKVSHYSILTNVTFTINSNTAVKGQGETDSSYSYATQNPLTKREMLIIERIKTALNETLNSRVQSVLAFNDLIANSLGIFTTVVTESNGSKKYYMHDKPTLEESSTIYTQNANGYAYTNSGWNNGNPVWEYGFDKNGNLIVNKVNAYGIDVSKPNSDYRSVITPGVFSTYYGAVKVLDIVDDTAVINKIKCEQFECGRILMIPYIENGKIVGTNIVYVSTSTDEEEAL